MGKALLVMLSMLALSAQAATYRWVDADGSVTYGDRPPANGAAQMRNAATSAEATTPAGFGTLPYALRSVANRFPVRLYTSRGCEVCDAARAHLIQRGVPFTESILASDRDLAEFRRIGFTEFKVPSVSVGRERAQGFGAANWNALLDAAGYPEKSMLPAGWRPAAAEAMAPAVQPAPAAATPAGNGKDLGRRTQDAAPASVSTAASSPAATPQGGGVPERPYATPATTPRGAPPPASPSAATSAATTSASSIRF